MSLTINAKAYAADRNTPDAVVYVGPAHTFSHADKAELKRVMPKPTSTFEGVARPNFKVSRTVTINATTGATATAIHSGDNSLPVGMTDGDIDLLLADLASFYGSAAAKALFKKLTVNQ